MIDLLASKTGNGDLLINLASRQLENHEWGMARLTIEQALERGNISDRERARQLLQDTCRRMGINPMASAA